MLLNGMPLREDGFGYDFPDTRPRIYVPAPVPGTSPTGQQPNRFDQITALISQGISAFTQAKQLTAQQQMANQALTAQLYAQSPQNNQGGIDNTVSSIGAWIQNNFGIVLLLFGGWFLLNMNPPSRRR